MSEAIESESTETDLDLNLLTQRNKLLILFFAGAFIGYLGIFVVDTFDGNFFEGEGSSLALKVCVGLAIFSALGYLIILGKMATQFNKSAFTWCFYALLFQIVGIIVSYSNMQKEVREARAALAKSGAQEKEQAIQYEKAIQYGFAAILFAVLGVLIWLLVIPELDPTIMSLGLVKQVAITAIVIVIIAVVVSRFRK